MQYTTLPIKFILETICDDIMPKTREIVTMEEKLVFAKKSLEFVHMENGLIYLKFDEKNQTPIKDFPFYNYLLVEKINRFKCSGNETEYEYHIRGFNTFGEMEKYIIPPYSKRSYYSVYVRCGTEYKKGMLMFSYQVSEEERVYVNQYALSEIHYVDEGFCQNSETKYYVEIANLCEIHRPTGVITDVVSSLVDLYYHIESIAIQNDEGIEFFEEGTAYFNHNSYKYNITISDEGVEYYLLNSNGDIYCNEMYRFCRFRTLCEGCITCF